MDEFRRQKTAYVTIGLIGVNIIYFIYLELTGSTEDVNFMVAHGAMYTPLGLGGGVNYRLLSSMFMHFGINHIMNNMLILFILGDNLERALGHAKYLVLYLVSGIGANVFSMLYNIEESWNVVSAGASGAIFGVIGVLLYAVSVNRGRLEDLSSRQLVIMIVCSLYFGFTSTGVDNVAHISGLLIGIFMGLILYRRPKKRERIF